MSKETAFYPRLQALTDEWMDLFGYWAPTVVTDTEEEYRAVRESAGLMDFTMLRKVDLDGPGALELVNSWPGVGLMMFEAVMRRDLPVIMGVTLIVGIVVVVSNLLTDIAVAAADPRIRY